MKVLVLCESGALGLKVLYCLRSPSIEVHTAGSDGASMLRYSRYARSHTTIDFWGDGAARREAADWVARKVRDKDVDVVIPSDIASQAFLAAVRDSDPGIPVFPCCGMQTLDTLHDKWSFAEVCRNHSLPSPKTVPIDRREILTPNWLDALEFPVMVKPLQAESSHGVVKIDAAVELMRYLDSGARYTALPLIAQSYIPGRDIDISILAAADDVLCSTVQSWVGDDVLEFTSDIRMMNIAQAIVRAFHYEGLAHFDMRIDERDGKLYVIECNPRAWYTIAASMWQGLNFIEAGIQYALTGEVPEFTQDAGRGRFCLAGGVAKRLLPPFKGFGDVTSASMRGFMQAVSDPLPHMVQRFRSF